MSKDISDPTKVGAFVPTPDEAFNLGKAIGWNEATEEAGAAHAAGEIELWLDLNTTRSLEEWEAWEAEHGKISEYEHRWIKQEDNT